MDYKRIYADFIKSRADNPPAEGEYSEVHHILPRCLGGGDNPGNLVRLTPEDHYFAHLLLAKIHGGRQWAAVHAMCHLANKSTKQIRARLHARMQFGHVRRSLARYYRATLSGPSGKIADKRIHELRSFDGRTAKGNRFELEEQTGIPRQQISALLRGRHKSTRGWYSPTHNPDGLTKGQVLSDRKHNPEVLTLHHYDGRIWTGTRRDFRSEFGEALTFQHPEGCVLGWYRTHEHALQHGRLRQEAVQKAADARGAISGGKNPNADPAIYRFRIIETGEIVSATKVEIRRRFNIKSNNLCSLFNGRQTKTGGIALAE